MMESKSPQIEINDYFMKQLESYDLEKLVTMNTKSNSDKQG